MARRGGSGRVSRRDIALAPSALLLGAVLIALSQLLNLADLWKHLLRDFGIALVIAPILGFVVETRFRQRLVEDTFKASIGYLLPDELKEELQWIYTQGLLCVEHTQVCTLEISQEHPDCVILTGQLFRTFKNIGNSAFSFDRGLAIDEWHHPSGLTSRILLEGREIEHDRRERSGTEIPIERDGAAVRISHPETISIPPQAILKVWVKYQEIKRENDAHEMVFRFPTINPQVILNLEEPMQAEVGFGHRAQAGLKPEAGNRYQLSGTLLPNQHIRIRWWRRE